MNVIWQAPFSDKELNYDNNNHRYILTAEYCRDKGIDLDIVIDKNLFPDTQTSVDIVLDRISLLVYTNIYNYGRHKEDKEYLLACNPQLRTIIRDAMFERLNYVTSSGDLSTKSGALIDQGTRVSTRDLIPSVVEEMILRPTGLLHRGKFEFIKDENLVY
jgi:hypothetical protein